jgi:hypothetical protein
MSTSASDTQQAQEIELWTIRGLIARHKRAAVVLLALLLASAALIVIPAFGSKAGAVTDSTTCTQWGSANVNRQSAYAELYVAEHGPVPRWGSSPTMVINAINAGCFQAYGDDVGDTTTLVQAVKHTF